MRKPKKRYTVKGEAYPATPREINSQGFETGGFELTEAQKAKARKRMGWRKSNPVQLSEDKPIPEREGVVGEVIGPESLGAPLTGHHLEEALFLNETSAPLTPEDVWPPDGIPRPKPGQIPFTTAEEAWRIIAERQAKKEARQQKASANLLKMVRDRDKPPRRWWQFWRWFS